MQQRPRDPSLLNRPTVGSVPYVEHRLAGLDSSGLDGGDIQEEGVIVAVSTDGVWVETQRQSGCQSCSSRGGCGVGIMQKALNRRQHTVQVQTDLPVQVGDHVRLLLPAAALVQASVLMYFLPLLGLIVGAVVGPSALGLRWRCHRWGSSGFFRCVAVDLSSAERAFSQRSLCPSY